MEKNNAPIAGSRILRVLRSVLGAGEYTLSEPALMFLETH